MRDTPGGRLNIKISSYQYGDSMLKIRRSHDRLIFYMWIPIPGKDGLYIETGPSIEPVHGQGGGRLGVLVESNNTGTTLLPLLGKLRIVMITFSISALHIIVFTTFCAGIDANFAIYQISVFNAYCSVSNAVLTPVHLDLMLET